MVSGPTHPTRGLARREAVWALFGLAIMAWVILGTLNRELEAASSREAQDMVEVRAAHVLPVPICSCGVIPMYRGLIEAGTPRSAAIAFLIASPEIGWASMLLSLSLLGGPMTVLRVAGAPQCGRYESRTGSSLQCHVRLRPWRHGLPLAARGVRHPRIGFQSR